MKTQPATGAARGYSLAQRVLSRLMKVFFRLLYHPFAWTYDLVAYVVSAGMWKSWVKAPLPFLGPGRVLELGHGPGHLQLAMREKGISSVALDASRQMGRIAYLRLKSRNYVPFYVNGYAQFLPFQANTFQQIVATFPTEYISQRQALAEIARVLSPGGELIVLPSAWITGGAPLHRALAWLFRVTGQAPSPAELRAQIDPGGQPTPAFCRPFLQAGFQSVEVRWIEQPNSLVMLVIARK